MQLVYNTHSNNAYKKDDIYCVSTNNRFESQLYDMYKFNVKFLAKLARNNAPPSIVTFDQPVFWKSSKIINTSTDSISDYTVVMLGTFHTV